MIKTKKTEILLETCGRSTRLRDPMPGSNAGSLSANVAVDQITVFGGCSINNQAPEPSTLLLSILGLAGTGLATWRKWRQRRTAATAL